MTIVSQNLFGSEINTFKVKLASVFICFEYEVFVKTFLTEYNYQYSFETLILNTVEYRVGALHCWCSQKLYWPSFDAYKRSDAIL